MKQKLMDIQDFWIAVAAIIFIWIITGIVKKYLDFLY